MARDATPNPGWASAETSACLARLARLRGFVSEHALDGAVVLRPEHVRYLTGWAGKAGPASLVIARDAFLVAPEGSHDPDRCDRLGVEVIRYPAYDPHRLVDPVAASRATLVGLLERLGLRGRVAVEPDRLPVAVAAAIPRFEPIDVDRPLARWRRVKDAFEVASIRRSVLAVERGFGEARTMIRPGLREVDLFAALESAVSRAAGSPVRLDGNLGSGPRSALDDPHQTDRAFEIGDMVLIDLYPVVDGYVSDLTRMFVVGPPTTQQQDRHDALVSALGAGAARLRPGGLARDVERAVRLELERVAPGLAASMTHHAGHGIGLEPWEEPWIGRADDSEIEAGMVVAIEPGLYIEGAEGLRLEGNYLVTDGGAERLDAFPSVLVQCGA